MTVEDDGLKGAAEAESFLLVISNGPEGDWTFGMFSSSLASLEGSAFGQSPGFSVEAASSSALGESSEAATCPSGSIVDSELWGKDTST